MNLLSNQFNFSINSFFFLERISTIYEPENISIKMNKSITVRLVHISSGKHSLAVWSTVRSFAIHWFHLNILRRLAE